ncbi:MAG: 50S ribosomal protein L22 [Candidatus Wildermuthbacteria bacterium]|nr:50S ribosomal protein L22 [Candidatus Wildermuthbacteria bacterium]
MKSIAHLRHLRISARKVRMITDLVRNKSFEDASRILRFALKRGAHPVLKLLNSALANAKQKFNAQEQNLRIAKITVDDGPKLKRYRPRARGQTYPIHKKTSHITIVLEEIQPTVEKSAEKMQAPKEPIAEKPAETEAAAVTQKGTAPAKKPLREERSWQKNIRRIPRIFRRKAI